MDLSRLNSTHAAWLNTAAAIIALALPVVTSTPGIPAIVVALVLGINAALHALLPDAPKA